MIRIEDVQFKYKKDANKFLRKHETVREKFKSDVMKIINNDHPEQVNFKELKGNMEGFSRIAIGSYRIIYILDNDEIVVVTVFHAGSRGDIYKKFRG